MSTAITMDTLVPVDCCECGRFVDHIPYQDYAAGACITTQCWTCEAEYIEEVKAFQRRAERHE